MPGNAIMPGVKSGTKRALIELCKRLEDRLGKSITSFDYPYGEYDNRIIEAVGYSCAFTTGHLYASREPDVFQIPRFELLGSVHQLAEIYQGQGHWFYRLLNDYYRVRDLAR
jgi:hypothetical protein